MIPYGRQDISEADIAAVTDVLRSDFLTQGPAAPRFEAAVGARVGARHAVAVNSATSALHIACAALDLGPGDILWTSPVTFVASANCGRYCGAEVDFVDIDPETFNICADALEAKLDAAARAGRLPKVIVAVHMCGQSPDMARIAVSPAPTVCGSSRMPAIPSGPITSARRSAIARSPTSPCSAFTPSRSSPPPRGAWR